MAYEQRNNSGNLFKNTKPNSERSPQWSGKAMIDGKMRFFDAWEKQDKNGNTWLSCSFKEMDKVKQEYQSQKPTNHPMTNNHAFENDIPF